MGRDLFSCDLATLTFSDVEDFVALGVEEGLRIDYKDQVPQKLGDISAAFSNTLGGIALLGVRRNNRAPVEITGIGKSKNSDLKTQLTNKIVTTVYPRPDFMIGVAAHPLKPDHEVAVVRIEPGGEPPYMYTPERKVSVRIEDQNMSTSLTDLEVLFRRRGAASSADFVPEDRDIFVETVGDHNHGQRRAETWFRVWLWPSQSLNLRIDRRIETVFQDAMSTAFPEFREIRLVDRHGTWTDLAFQAHAVQNLNARWRLTANGSLGFVIQPFHTGKDAVLLADVVTDAARFLRSGALLLRALGWEGRVSADATLVTMDHRVLPSSADRPHVLDGITSIGTRSNRGAPTWAEMFASPSSVDAPRFLADLLIDSLRTERCADIDYERLHASITRMLTHDAAATP